MKTIFVSRLTAATLALILSASGWAQPPAQQATKTPTREACQPPAFWHQGACWRELAPDEDCTGEVMIAHLEDQPVFCRVNQIVPIEKATNP